jgi:hypothetical protein
LALAVAFFALPTAVPATAPDAQIRLRDHISECITVNIANHFKFGRDKLAILDDILAIVVVKLV